MTKLKLYTYFRSSAAYRVRIALNLKQLPYTSEYVHLINNGGQQHSKGYTSLNPQGLIPSLVINNQTTLTQSLAILEYLEDLAPQTPLLPTDPLLRAQVRAFAQAICCDIHPLNNLRVHAYLKNKLSVEDKARTDWYQHWVLVGFKALETLLERNKNTTEYCFNEQPTFADVCLIPQVYNAKRFQCNLEEFPIINRIYNYCLTLEAFTQASPEAQADYA